MSGEDVRAVGVTMDCADPARLADFWQAAIGFRSRAGGADAITLSDAPTGRPLNHLSLQRVPEGKTAKHRVHLDLFAADGSATVARLVALGATVLRRPEVDDPGHMGFVATILADPEGGEFCVVSKPQ